MICKGFMIFHKGLQLPGMYILLCGLFRFSELGAAKTVHMSVCCFRAACKELQRFATPVFSIVVHNYQ